MFADCGSDAEALSDSELSELLPEPEASRGRLHKYWTWQNCLGGGILLISYALCIPGLFYYDSCVAWPLTGKELAYSAYGLVDLLWNSAHNELRREVDPSVARIPAALIFIFSIAMPFLKFLATIVGVCKQSEAILWIVARVSKFQHVDGQIVMLLKCYLQLKPIIHVELRIGFYLFLFYCILSSAGVQIILSQFVKKERVAQHQSTKDLWLPIAVAQVSSIVVFFFCSTVMSVNPVDPSTDLHLARIDKSMVHVLLDSDLFVAIWLLLTIVLLPCLTYIVLPLVLEFGNPKQIERLGGRESLQLLIEYAHDWSLGDVLLLAYIIMFFIVLSVKWTNPEIHPVGGYCMIFFGISSGFMIYLFQLNACMQAKKHMACGNEGARRRVRHRASSRKLRCCCSNMCPLPLHWRLMVYALALLLYGSLAGMILHVFQHFSKPPPNLNSMEILNEAFKTSLTRGGDREGILHTMQRLLLGSRARGSIGSCSRKGLKGGPPGDLPCMDVPSYQIPETKVDALSFSAFESRPGGPIYNGSVSVSKLLKMDVEVSFVAGLENVKIDSLQLVDLGMSPMRLPGQDSSTDQRTRRMQFVVSLVINPPETPALKQSVPISLQIGPTRAVPCCNPKHVTVTFDLTCNRRYPFFSFQPGGQPVSVRIDPSDALSIAFLKVFHIDFGFSQAALEEKLAQLMGKYARKSVNASLIPNLGVFYPYKKISLADGLSFMIQSNLPATSSMNWNFCPEA